MWANVHRSHWIAGYRFLIELFNNPSTDSSLHCLLNLAICCKKGNYFSDLKRADDVKYGWESAKYTERRME